MKNSSFIRVMEVLTGATIDKRGGDWGDTISVGGISTEEIARGFIQFDKMGADKMITNLVPFVSSWWGSMMK